MADDDRIHPDIKRAIGKAEAHALNADRLLDGSRPRKKEPSLADIKDGLDDLRNDWEEDSAVIRAELAKRPSDASALSVHGPMGWHLSARGRVVWLLAIVLGVAVVGVVLGRATAPHGHREAPIAK